MEIKVSSTAFLLLFSTTFAAGTFETWNGLDGSSHIQTGIDKGAYSGYLDLYFDDFDGGMSIINLDYEHSDWDGNGDYFEELLEQYHGMSGTAVLDPGALDYLPFVGVRFWVAGVKSDKHQTPLPADISAWGGLCVTYSSEADMSLELVPEQKHESNIAKERYSAALPKTAADKKIVLSWSDFKEGEAVSQKTTTIQFILQAEPGSYHFNICAIGPKDGACPDKCGEPNAKQGINAASAGANAKALLDGRTLAFTGVRSATAEVMNSLGQIVAKGVIEGPASTLSLAHLNAGIYLVRVAGENAHFTSRITLK
ncbi:T9SS type A sorting domain-containing protein [uncultured Fibrobacter sp.]|uniref:T9SS type A sorting domain-containing protein n=1 Tax=uncultured Fibrobacter sp. TaxID=261512 RepID=UPI0025F00D13|nr:T9SS type A sorting domain-containing protein [uncultured Fibrobacter sp.]